MSPCSHRRRRVPSAGGSQVCGGCGSRSWSCCWITYRKRQCCGTLTAYVPVSITGFFNVTLAYNKGAAFSFLDTASGWQTWFFGTVAVAVSVAILICLKKLTYQERWQGIALALIMGGALGNLWDRISLGYVIDFLDFHWLGLHWPAFNVADSAICIGAIMLFFDALAIRKK